LVFNFEKNILNAYPKVILMDNEFITNLRPMMEDLQRLFAQQETILHFRVNELLARNSKDINEINHLMDDLFNNMFYGRGIDDFQRLKAHLADLDPDAADFSTNANLTNGWNNPRHRRQNRRRLRLHETTRRLSQRKIRNHASIIHAHTTAHR
jgi:hypothetical protein